jgi:hypothetical protein
MATRLYTVITDKFWRIYTRDFVKQKMISTSTHSFNFSIDFRVKRIEIIGYIECAHILSVHVPACTVRTVLHSSTSYIWSGKSQIIGLSGVDTNNSNLSRRQKKIKAPKHKLFSRKMQILGFLK